MHMMKYILEAIKKLSEMSSDNEPFEELAPPYQ